MTPAERWQQLRPILALRSDDGKHRCPDLGGTLESHDDRPAEEAALLRTLVSQAHGVDGIAWDAGCGTGEYTAALCARFRHVLATEGDAARLHLARSRQDLHAEFWPLSLLDARFTRPEFHHAFSFIQCIQVLGHLATDDAAAVLAMFADARAADGTLILAVPYTHRAQDVFCVTTRAPNGDISDEETSAARHDSLVRSPAPAVCPTRHFSMPTLHDVCRRAGLLLREVHPYNRGHAMQHAVMLVF